MTLSTLSRRCAASASLYSWSGSIMIDVPPSLRYPRSLGDPIHLTALFNDLQAKTNSGTVLLLAARLEKTLEALIKLHMAPIGVALAKRIFEGPNSPLGTLHAKIEIARGLHLISASDYQALHAIRDIRNLFAHSDEELHFNSADPDLEARFARLPGSTKGTRAERFLDAVIACSKSLAATHDRITRELIAKAEAPTLPETSARPSDGK